MELSALPALELFNAAGNEIAAVDCVLPSVRRLLLDDNRLPTIPRGVLRCHRLQVAIFRVKGRPRSWKGNGSLEVWVSEVPEWDPGVKPP